MRPRTEAFGLALTLLLSGRLSAVSPTPPAKAAPAAAAPALPVAPPPKGAAEWLEGFFPWGEGTVTLEEFPQAKIPNYRLFRVKKSYKAGTGLDDQTFAAFENDSRAVLIGDLFVDEERLKSPAPLKSDADLDPMRERLKKYVRGGFRIVLAPPLDHRGWKGLRFESDTGYGNYGSEAYVTARDGVTLIVGRFWDRSQSFVEQRKKLLKLFGPPTDGPADAKITVVEFSDLECGFCKRRSGQWEPLLKRLPELKIRRYFKSFPLTFEHPWAFRAASAARCFFEKDPKLFFKWKSAVYERQEQLSVAALDAFVLDFATASDVSQKELSSCYLQAASTKRVLEDLSEGYAVRVRSTPTYFVDGVAVAWYSDNTMEEFLRTKYLKGAGLPLPTATPTPPTTPTVKPK